MIEITEFDHVDIVEMKHGKVNAMDCEFLAALIERIRVFLKTPKKYLVFRSGLDSKVFSAGIDLKRIVYEPPSYAREFFPLLIELFEQIYFCKKTIIACVEGAAIAGGCIMATGAQARIATETARFGMPNKALNVPIPQLAIQILHDTLPNDIAAGLHDGQLLSAAEAQGCGLISQSISSGLTSVELAELVETLSRTETRPAEYVDLDAQQKDRDMTDQWCTEALRQRVGEYVNKILAK